MIKVELLGAKEIMAAFAGLPYQFTDSIVQKANVKAATPLVHRMHRLAPVGLTGNLADSIGVVKQGKKSQELGAVEVGPRRKGGYKGFAGHLVEFGTKPRTSNGANRGRMPAEPFEEPAFESSIGEVRDRQAIELSNVTTSYLKRVLR